MYSVHQTVCARASFLPSSPQNLGGTWAWLALPILIFFEAIYCTEFFEILPAGGPGTGSLEYLETP